MKVISESEVVQSCPSLYDSMDYSLPGFSVNEIFQARVMEWVATAFSNKKIWKLWYIYTMEYYSAIKKNSFESVLMKWMKLEPIIQSEVSQKDEDQYSILTHIY